MYVSELTCCFHVCFRDHVGAMLQPRNHEKPYKVLHCRQKSRFSRFSVNAVKTQEAPNNCSRSGSRDPNTPPGAAQVAPRGAQERPRGPKKRPGALSCAELRLSCADLREPVARMWATRLQAPNSEPLGRSKTHFRSPSAPPGPFQSQFWHPKIRKAIKRTRRA